MKKLLLAVVLALTLLFTGTAFAGNTAQLEWSFPATEITNIQGYNVYMRTEGQEYTQEPTLTALPDEFQGELQDLPDGQYWFVIAADYGMYESPRSAEGGIVFSNGEVSYPLSMSTPTILMIRGLVTPD